MKIKKLVIASGLILLTACATTEDKPIAVKPMPATTIFQTNIASTPNIEINNGCIAYTVIEQNIMTGFTARYFETNKDTAINVPEQQNECIAQVLKQYPLTLELQGFTDGTGAKSYNKKLAQRRAGSVKKELLTYLIKTDQLMVVNIGKVLISNDKKMDSLNRRVNLTIK
ncbi:OmpA family protein [Psychromonas antarctica]|uniref:OmpA family protein n=1 Tax=Psychromonas antarctica TaxID=67573 RepID=UPI001EE7F569|nr:OmpA family protein [Psychromonas antarctica]MCG6201236.1 OmpA family protein [Psychromonas antarctica]